MNAVASRFKRGTWPVNLGHGVTRRHHSVALLALFAATPLLAFSDANAQQPQPAAPDPRITPGQVIDGLTGLPIPCRCRYKGETYRLGDVVCMSTHVGTVLTRCELFLNNTSWVPSREPCTISELAPVGTDTVE